MKWTLLLAFFALWACQEEQISQEENLSNEGKPHPRVERLRTIKRVDNLPATRAVGVKAKLWQPGDTIRIKFQNADEYPGLSEKVIQYAAIWLQYANLYFEYVAKEDYADVKIGFNMDTRELSWSTIGTDCKQVPQNEVSLNIYALEEEIEEEVIQGEILRGFGHVLGLGFEHQSPDSPIKLNDSKTISYYMNSYMLTEQDIVNDILPYYNSDQTNYTEFDPLSIMTLNLPGIKTQNKPYYNLFFNYELSENDIRFVRDTLYPVPPRIDCIMEITTDEHIDFRIQIQDDITIEYGDEFTITCNYDPSYNIISRSYTFNKEGSNTVKIYGSSNAIINFITNSHNITSLVIHENNALQNLVCSNNHLSSLNTSNCSALEELLCDNNYFTNLNLSQNTNLKILDITNNQFNSIDISKNTNLEFLRCGSNNLTNIDISKNRYLYHLNCEYNQITSINLQENPEIIELFANHNNLQSIDVSQNPKIINLTVPNNQINNIRFYGNQDLTFLHCEHNKLNTLNISSLITMTVFYCQDNLFSREVIENIANNIRDCRGLENGGWGTVLYSPLNDTITEIFENKNWSIATAIPYSFDESIINSSPKLKELYSYRRKNYILFNKLYGDIWQ